MNWKNIKHIKKSKTEHICLVCKKNIPVGSSYIYKPYIPDNITDVLLELGFNSTWYDDKYGYGIQYVGIPLCSESCLHEAKLLSREYPRRWKEMLQPLINSKYESLKRISVERGIWNEGRKTMSILR
ncbi:MAG: hypothetical protein NWE99_00030 [Candidatus Bathyarchaeota archaeon]|nr:hypothetical protein [Candidatus Bathyarchaeota archaeon]